MHCINQGDLESHTNTSLRPRRSKLKETPEEPLLCSLYGAWYCDLLLAQAERAAWKSFLGVGAAHLVQECFATCESVSARAIQMLNSSRNRSLLDVALARLVLVRARLAQ